MGLRYPPALKESLFRQFNFILSYNELRIDWRSSGLGQKSISSCLYVNLRGLDFSAALKISTKNSDGEKKLDFRSGTSRDKIKYEARSGIKQRGKTSDWLSFAGKSPMISQWQGYKTWEMTSVCFDLPWSEKCKKNNAWFWTELGHKLKTEKCKPFGDRKI